MDASRLLCTALLGAALMLLTIAAAAAVGIGPGTVTVDYVPGKTETIGMIAVNTIDVEGTYTISASESYIKCTPLMVTVPPGTSEPFTCAITIPELDLPPGVHPIARIRVSELPSTAAGTIGGVAAVESIVRVKVPNVGKHLSVGLSVENAAQGSDAPGRLRVSSGGTEALEQLEATVRLLNKNGAELARLPPIRIDPLQPGESREYAILLPTAGLTSGEYRAVVEIPYDDRRAHAESLFKVGEMRIAIKNLTAEPVAAGGVAKFTLETDSFWGETIDYQITLRILQHGSQMGATTMRDQIDPWQHRYTPVFWETANAAVGTYDAEVRLNYAEREDTQLFPGALMITAAPPPQQVAEPAAVQPVRYERMLLGVIGVLVVFIILILVRLLRRREPPQRAVPHEQQQPH